MKQIASTLNVFLRQEWITVATYFIATIFFLFMIFQIGTNVAEDGKREYAFIALLMITMLSFFMGIYLGTGLLRLQQSHLWQLHERYRLTLITSFVSGAFLYGLIQLYPMLYAGWAWYIAALAPPCITLLAAQLVVGNHIVMKIIFPASPFILFQLTHYDATDEIILILLIAITLLALVINSKNRRVANAATLGLVNGSMQNQIKNIYTQKLNSIVADIYHNIISTSSSKSFNTALVPPISRYGFIPVVTILVCIILMHFVDGDNKVDNAAFAVMMMGSMIMGSFIELKQNARQTKPIVHLYSQDHHSTYKSTILKIVDRHVTTQTILLIVAMLLVNIFIQDFVSPLLMIKMGFTVTLVAGAFLPLMLCLNWFKLNFKLIATLLLYFSIGVVTLQWQYKHELIDLLSLEALIGLIMIISIRLSSTYLWRRQAVEQFMRVYG
jgi:hypothetical protein